MRNKEQWYCRTAPSLGALERTPEEAWGTPIYDPEKHINEPTVFFGLYGFPDFFSLWRHRGQKAILFAGSDIVHFNNGYFLDAVGNIRIQPRELAKWINENCESWVENEEEKRILLMSGIESQVCASFLGDIQKYDISFLLAERPQVYASVSGENFESYGWYLIDKIADSVPEVDFHLFGALIDIKRENVFVRGRVPKEQMNEEIKDMQCGLRLNPMDGFSEITAKSVLWGQYPIVRARFNYPYLDSFETEQELIGCLKNLRKKKEPNFEARKWYWENLNLYPWAR